MTDCNIYNNTASQYGGGMHITGGKTTMTTTLLHGNTQSNGETSNIEPTGGLLYYQLPTPPGYWLPNSDCVANRAPCGSLTTTTKRNACNSAVLSGECSKSGTSDNDWTPTSCNVPLNVQPCDWKTDACAAGTSNCLLGKKVYFVPYFSVDVTFPYPCAAGVLGSNESTYQTSSTCKGKCPSGFYCPTEVTTEPIICPQGSYCIEGSSTPTPCPSGTFGNASGLASALECTVCPSGSACAIGSTGSKACSPGTFSNQEGGGECSRCSAGTYQDAEGQTSCKACEEGSYCSEGAAAALPCPASTFSAATNLTSPSECTPCPLGHSCSTSSTSPTPCSAGSVAPTEGMASCSPCSAGTYQDAEGETSCRACEAGSYCTEGAAAALPCPASTFSNEIGLSSAGKCAPCPAGHSCSTGSVVPSPCASGTYGDEEGLAECTNCVAGTYQDEEGKTSCKACRKGSYCPAGSKTPTPCPAGFYAAVTGLRREADCTPVQAGFWAPTGSAKPEPCPESGFYCPGWAEDTVNEVPGSKPIVLKTGGTSKTVTVEVEEVVEVEAVHTELILDQDLDTIDRAVLIQQLADVYGVPSEAISLSASAGSVVVTFSIDPSLLQDVTVEELAAQMQGVNVTSLATALGASVQLVKQPTVEVRTEVVKQTVTKQVQVSCPAGFWCSAGKQIPCPLRTYSNVLDADDQGDCKSCPPDSYTASVGSRDASACICQEGFYNNASFLHSTTSNKTLELGTIPHCLSCTVGMDCSRGGSVLPRIVLTKGHWRETPFSTNVFRCPDGAANTSGCRGGAGDPCAAGLTGTFCQLCELGEQSVYYVSASKEEVAHCELCGDTNQRSIIMGSAAVFLLPLVAMLVMRCVSKVPPSVAEKAALIHSTYSPLVKAKVLLGFYMVATKVSSVYDVEFPAEVKRFLSSFKFVVSFGLEGFSTPLECFGLRGYVPRLAFWVVVPVCVAVLVVGFMVVRIKVGSCPKGASFSSVLVESSAPWMLRAVFLLYPIVTNAAFEAFPCYSLDRSWLIADVGIECYTDEHRRAMWLAWVTIFSYPIGVFAVLLALLMRASPAILAGKSTILSRSIHFLYAEYVREAFWWELAEMIRRFVLVGLFVVVEPGTIMQITLATIFCAVYLMVQLQVRPFKRPGDNYLALAASFSLMMLFLCSIIYKLVALTDQEELQEKMSLEQKRRYVVPSLVLSTILFASVAGCLVATAVILAVQLVVDVRERSKLRRLRYEKTGREVVLPPVEERAFHLFLSHAWPTAQDRMRIVKERFADALPSCKVFLDVDDLHSGSGTREVDTAGCVLIFCTKSHFEKKNSMKELYRAVVQRRPILAMLEPDETQDGGLDKEAITLLLSDARLDRFGLRQKWEEWREGGELLPAAFDHPPNGADVAAALFSIEPVEWNRLPQFQDVTIRLIAQNGILRHQGGMLYLQNEMAASKIRLPPPRRGCAYHLFCSKHNAGAAEVVEEAVGSGIVAKGRVEWTSAVDKLDQCERMLILLDDRTWTSGKTTAALIEHIHAAMRKGVHLCCVHEFPSLVGAPRHECEFHLMFNDDWTPEHLTKGESNIYKEIAVALKAGEWRKPGLVALLSHLAADVSEHKPVNLLVPKTYEPSRRLSQIPPKRRASITAAIRIQANEESKLGAIVQAQCSHPLEAPKQLPPPPSADPIVLQA